jgi:hypothetical protein
VKTLFISVAFCRRIHSIIDLRYSGLRGSESPLIAKSPWKAPFANRILRPIALAPG